MRVSSASAAAIGLAVAAFWIFPGVARAELQRVEAVGIYGIRDGARSRVIPRDEAIAKARWEGVSRVALELIGESAPSEEEERTGVDATPFPPETRGVSGDSGGPSRDQLAALRAALGRDVLPYMRSYRILDDRGEVPVLFNEEPGVTMEYVVVVEVLVDVDRVSGALAKAGLIVLANVEETRQAVVVEVVGLARYEALEVLLAILRERMGATRIHLLEFSRERQILSVEGPLGPDALSASLARYDDPRLVLEARGVDTEGRRIRLLGRWFPASDDSPDAAALESAPESTPDRLPRAEYALSSRRAELPIGNELTRSF